MKIDMHIHSVCGNKFDSSAEPEDIIRVAKEKGLDGIVITEHNSFEDSEPWEEYKDSTLKIFRGVEYTFAHIGHILIYGIESDHQLEEIGDFGISHIPDNILAEGYAMVGPHPFSRYGLGENWIPKYKFHALELNNRQSYENNLDTMRLARMYGFNLIAGSDAHKAEDVGECYTEFEREIGTIHDLVAELKAGRFMPSSRDPDIQKMIKTCYPKKE